MSMPIDTTDLPTFVVATGFLLVCAAPFVGALALLIHHAIHGVVALLVVLRDRHPDPG